MTRLVVALLVIILATSCGHISTPRPTSPTSVRVSDRFGRSVQGIEIIQSRWVSGWWFILPPGMRTVSSPTTLRDGTAHFADVCIGDVFSAESTDRRFQDSATASRKSPAQHDLTLNHHTGFAIVYLPEFDRRFEADSERFGRVVSKILDYHQTCRQWDFRSIADYRTTGVIDDMDTRSFEAVRSMMLGNKPVLQYRWGSFRLTAPDLTTQVTWKLSNFDE